MNDSLLPLLGSGAVGAVIVAIIGAVTGRRKLGAEATEILTKAAGGMVERLEADNKRLRDADEAKTTKIDELEHRVDDLEDEQRAWEREREDWLRVLQVHAAWDTLAIATLREAHPPIDLPDPPPLTPPVRARRAS